MIFQDQVTIRDAWGRHQFTGVFAPRMDRHSRHRLLVPYQDGAVAMITILADLKVQDEWPFSEGEV